MPSNEASISTHNGSALDADPHSVAEGARRTHHIPQIQTKEDVRRWQLEQMAGAFRVLAKLGLADGASGHISLWDPVEPDTFWINPYGVHFGLLRVSDMVRVDERGVRVGGAADAPVSTGGFLIHSAVHRARGDINVAVHSHAPYGRAWSVFGRPVEMLCQDSCMFLGDLAVYEGFGGVVFGEEGGRIAAAMGDRAKNVILRNHGILSGGGTVGEAVGFFIALERACQTQLLVERAAAGGGGGLVKTYVDEEVARYTKRNIGSADVMYMQFEPEYRLILKETGGDFLE